jgi:2-polyprenyl-3-methyl-5-hydroxy-6-metoxy-1,4-benzoquinol methylase
MALDEVQEGNKNWWTQYQMSYDWRHEIEAEKYSLEWFDNIDKRFIESSYLFAHEHTPFEQIIPFDRLNGCRVLEIGCGMGLHTELMIRAGASVTAIDISPVSVEATRKRLEFKALSAKNHSRRCRRNTFCR